MKSNPHVHDFFRTTPFPCPQTAVASSTTVAAPHLQLIRLMVLKAILGLVFVLSVVPIPSAWAQAQYRPGDRVEVDIIMAGAVERAIWKTGTISRIDNGDYIVRLDNGEQREMPIRPDKHWVRPAQKQAAKAPQPSPALPGRSATAPLPQANTQSPASASANPSVAQATAQDAALTPPGLGSPPNGIYNCQKIGQTYMGLGPLEIRGNTYRGIGSTGEFHPFTVDAKGQIHWSAGIAGLPDGWTIVSSFYAGKDTQNRPMMKIYYRSKSGWNDLIDCVMEKP